MKCCILKYLLILLACSNPLLAQQGDKMLRVSQSLETGGFPLIHQQKAATIYYDLHDAEVVGIAAHALADDIFTLSGIRPELLGNKKLPQYAVIIGTIGKSKLVDELIVKRKIASGRNKWEEFTISLVDQPFKGVEKALVIAGSDRRGTAFGVFELSRMLGVSPLTWWADVIPEKRGNLYINKGKPIVQSPSVKYRGIFLNDEDWGLQPWAAKNIDTDIKDIGPKTYAKIFELLLRLKANYIWPAMHPSTKAFYYYPENPVMADKYAIVVGASHCEPMLRNNVFEWAENFEHEYGKKPGEWRYDLNKAEIDTYWTDRLKQSRNYESVYTIGMRGIHDGSMPGPKDRKEKLKLLGEVIDNQRKLFSQNFTTSVNQIPQIFCPYKEVLTLYRMGLELPDDVTIVWADDNHGYIRQLSNPEEQERPGGSGVYYHLSYWGAPQDYLWLSSISPSLISFELSKAYAYQARNLWVINVGDIKPAEMETQFAMDLAWDVNQWKPENAHAYAEFWAAETFGEAYAKELAEIKSTYYRLAAAGKPEHLPYINFTEMEKEQRLSDYVQLARMAEDLKLKIHGRLQDAYFQLIYYPVMGAKLMNEKVFFAQKSLALAAEGKDSALAYAKSAEKAFEQIKGLTKQYNEEIAGGKWNGMMDWKPRNREVFNMPAVANTALIHKGKSDPIVKTATVAPAIISIRDFVGSKDAVHAKIHYVAGLGFREGGQTLMPFYIPAVADEEIQNAAYLEYSLNHKEGEHTIAVKCLPTQGVYDGRKVRYAIAVGNEKPQVINVAPASENETWRKNVLQGYAIGESKHQFKKGANHIRIYFLDPGTVINQLEIY